MASLNEKLAELYPKKPVTSTSWIPRRPYHLDPVEQYRKDHTVDHKKQEDHEAKERLMLEAIEEIFSQVEDLFKERHGEGSVLDNKLCNFAKSWEFHFQKNGSMLVWAVGEMTEEMSFVTLEGFLKMDSVKEKIIEIEKRAKRRQ